ncbi:MAG: DUF2189 domain-containing protein [Rhodocyclaceae bacterium]|nr:DUF2189 domain-containing protein [Rhodocyclaceae bacterium]MBX3669394.1 DUF2189 domain-containing protein [Rhodocyclaceae bacterium]
MLEHGSTAPQRGILPPGAVRHVSPAAPFRWLLRGLRDMLAYPAASLFYGACFASLGFLLYAYTHQAVKYMAALTSAFALAGPFIAIGLYDISRRRDAGLPCKLGATTIAWLPNVGNIATFGGLLGILMLAWTAVALILFTAFYGNQSPTLGELFVDVVNLRDPIFVLSYGFAGGLFAALVFSVSVVSIPMMLDRNCNVFYAMRASVVSTVQNLPAMFIWAAIIVTFTSIGLFSFYVGLMLGIPLLGHAGLILTMPLIGHASWHAYRDIVAPEADIW